MFRQTIVPGVPPGALPNLVVIGAMKCGTTALHGYLDRHPRIAMSTPKELNFFFGPEDPPESCGGHPWTAGNWHRGLPWYTAHFDHTAPVRGESSPGYTSPAHRGAAERMAACLPDVRLVYLVRDPIERALSQYRHHAREGTEPRPPESALLDPASQYVSRGRYYDRLRPFLETFDGTRILVLALEELKADRRRTLETLFDFLLVDGDYPWPSLDPVPATDAAGTVGAEASEHRSDDGLEPVRRRLADAVRDDAERLRAFTGRSFPGWTV